MTDLLDLNKSFVWFVGTVLDVMDPDHLGRVKVRAIPFYANASEDKIPWAQCLQPVQSAAHQQIGLSPTGIAVGSAVVGFFADGGLGQQPIVLGTFAGTSDVSTLATGTDIPAVTRVNLEPKSSYAAEYPHNKALTTASGHNVQIDDTDGAERILVFHNSGSYVEMRPDGSVVYKTIEDRYDMTVGNHYLYAQQDLLGQVDGEINIKAKGNINISTAKTAKISANTKIILASPLLEINGPDDIEFVKNPEENESTEPHDTAGESDSDRQNNDIPGYGREIQGTMHTGPGGGVVANNVVSPGPPVSCGSYSSDRAPITLMSTEVAVPSYRHEIVGKRWRNVQWEKSDFVCNLGHVWENIVHPLFSAFPGKFNINSGFRPASDGSFHNGGMAVDLQIKAGVFANGQSYGVGNDIATVPYANWIRQNCPFDQLAMEYGNKVWIHVSCIRPSEKATEAGIADRHTLHLWNNRGVVAIRDGQFHVI